MKARVAIIAVVVVVFIVAVISHNRRANLLYLDNFRYESFGCKVNDAGYALIVHVREGLHSSADDASETSYVWHRGTLSSAYRLNAVGVDDRGDVAGNDDEGRPLLGTNGHVVLLPVPPGVHEVHVNAVSDSGVLGGTYRPSGQQSRHGILWIHGAYQDIPPPVGYAIAYMAGVADSGVTELMLTTSERPKRRIPVIYLNGAMHFLKMPPGATRHWSYGFVDHTFVASQVQLGSSSSLTYAAIWKSPYLGDPVMRPVPASYNLVRVLPTSDDPATWPLVLVGSDLTTVYIDVYGHLRKLASTGRNTVLMGINDKGLMTGWENDAVSPTFVQRWFPKIFGAAEDDERAVIYQTDLPEVLKEARTESR